jgi:hypothetical protein
MNYIKSIVKRIAGEGNLGRLDFFRHPEMQNGWGGPFNGQGYRQRIFFDLLYCFRIQAIVETGTFCGTTTALFAATGLPVYSVEISRRHYAYSKTRFFLGPRNLHLYHGDSRAFLKRLLRDKSVTRDVVFFYLDAHWEKECPLREELEIIFTGWSRPVVMVDDFQVPKSQYGFDDYGDIGALTISLLAPVFREFDLSAFFPAIESGQETGAKRGCVVLSRNELSLNIASNVKTLVSSRL